MFSISNMPSASMVLSAYTSFAASVMLARSMATEVHNMVDQLIPQHLQFKILSVFRGLNRHHSSQLTLVINEYDGYTFNQMFEGAELHMRTKITPSVDRLRVSKFPKDKNLSVSVERNQIIGETFQGIELKWRLVCAERDQDGREERKHLELSFHQRHKEVVLGTYLPYVLARSKTIKEENKAVKLYSLGFCGDDNGGGVWGSINLDHPATFETLAMDQKAKKELMEDLDRFVKRKDFYRRVGKAWKRGYLLYGPPGTGKSTLIAAMANYLNFNIYDLELASVHGNSDLRNLLVATATRSIIVIEDIDCSVELHDRAAITGHFEGDNKLTLSGLLNFMDGLWSSCGDERIIVFTTNHKDRLDPALLRPGRMDMHIHMSYCTPDGFRLLASNYLGIKHHRLFEEIEGLIKNVNATPAEVAEELMKSDDDAEIALKYLLEFLKRKATESTNSTGVEAGKGVQQSECQNEKKKKRKTSRKGKKRNAKRLP